MTLTIEVTTLLAIALTVAYYIAAAVITYWQSETGHGTGGYINLDLWGAFIMVVSVLVATIASLITWMVWMS